MELFSRNHISNYIKDQYKILINKVDINQSFTEGLDSYVDELLRHHFNQSVPELLEDVKSELVLENSHGQRFEPEQNAFYGGRHDVYATGIYYVPFKGNSLFFDLQPNNVIRVANAYIEDDTLIFKIKTGYVRLELPAGIESDLKQRAVHTRDSIVSNLTNLQTDFIALQKQVKDALIKYIDNKQLELKQQTDRNQRINPFI